MKQRSVDVVNELHLPIIFRFVQKDGFTRLIESFGSQGRRKDSVETLRIYIGSSEGDDRFRKIGFQEILSNDLVLIAPSPHAD